MSTAIPMVLPKIRRPVLNKLQLKPKSVVTCFKTLDTSNRCLRQVYFNCFTGLFAFVAICKSDRVLALDSRQLVDTRLVIIELG